MHELSIAISLIELAAEELARHGGGRDGVRVTALHLKLGEHSGVVKDALLGAFDLAAEQSPLAGARLIVQDVPVEIHCPHCGDDRPAASIQDLRCRSCGTPSRQIVRGRELELVAMEICDESEETAAC